MDKIGGDFGETLTVKAVEGDPPLTVVNSPSTCWPDLFLSGPAKILTQRMVHDLRVGKVEGDDC